MRKLLIWFFARSSVWLNLLLVASGVFLIYWFCDGHKDDLQSFLTVPVTLICFMFPMARGALWLAENRIVDDFMQDLSDAIEGSKLEK